MKILVYGANGSQTGAGTQILMDSGYEIRVLMRGEEKAQAWATKGAEVAIGQMDDLDSLIRASEGCDAIFLLIPTFRDSDEEGITYGVNAIKAAKAAGISKVIWNTAAPVVAEDSEQAATDPGAQVVRQLKAEGLSYLALQPTLYMENFLGPWTVQRLKTENIFSYPIPLNFKAHWVASSDFGLIADAALKSDLPNEIVQLGGPQALDGAEIAEIFSRVLNRQIIFETMPIDTFREHLLQAGNPRIAAIIAGLYQAIQGAPNQLEPAFTVDSEKLSNRFNVSLTSLESWVSAHQAMLK